MTQELAQSEGAVVERKPQQVPLGLLFVMCAVFFRLSRYTQESLIGLGQSSDVAFDIEAYKLAMLLPLGFMLLAALRWPRKTRVRIDTPLKFLLGLFVISAASLLWAYNPTYGIPWLPRLLMPIAIYFLIINYTTEREQLRWWAYMFVIMGILDVVISAVELPFLFRLWGSVRAADEDILGYIGTYARWATIGFAFSLHFLSFGKTRRETIFGLVGALCSLIAVYFTFRRAAFLVVGLTVLVYFVMIGRRRKEFVWFGIAAVLLAVIALAIDPRYAQRMASIGEVTNLGGVQTGDVRRIFQFFMGVKIFKEHWLLGIGVGNIMLYSQQIFGTGKWLPHNIYLEFGGELGIIGLGLFLAFAIASLRAGWLAYRAHLRDGDIGKASLTVAVLSALFGMLTYGMFQPIRHDFYIYVLAALSSLSWELLPAEERAAKAASVDTPADDAVAVNPLSPSSP